MKKKFICAVCGYIYEGDAAPEKCPICKAPASKFSELKDDGETKSLGCGLCGSSWRVASLCGYDGQQCRDAC